MKTAKLNRYILLIDDNPLSLISTRKFINESWPECIVESCMDIAELTKLIAFYIDQNHFPETVLVRFNISLHYYRECLRLMKCVQTRTNVIAIGSYTQQEVEILFMQGIHNMAALKDLNFSST